MHIWTSVNEVDVAKIQAGQRVEYTVDGIPNKSFVGTVNKIRPNATMSSNVVTYVVEIDIENKDRTFLPYMSAQANFIVKEEKDVLILANEALTFFPDEKYWAEGVTDPYAQMANPKEGEKATPSNAERGVVWQKVEGDKLRPLPILKLDNNGTHTMIQALGDTELSEGMEFISGAFIVEKKEASAKGKGMLEMKRPKRRQQGTGGAPKKH